MSASIIFEKFLSLPQIDFGKIWSWLKVQPTRPNSTEVTAKIVAAIKDEGDRIPTGYVFALSNGRFVLGLVGEVPVDLHLQSCYYLHNLSDDLTHTPDSSRRHSNLQPFHKVPSWSDDDRVTDAAVQKALVTTYYGADAPKKLKEYALA